MLSTEGISFFMLPSKFYTFYKVSIAFFDHL